MCRLYEMFIHPIWKDSLPKWTHLFASVAAMWSLKMNVSWSQWEPYGLGIWSGLDN